MYPPLFRYQKKIDEMLLINTLRKISCSVWQNRNVLEMQLLHFFIFKILRKNVSPRALCSLFTH